MSSNLQSTTDDGGRDDGSLTFSQPPDDEGRDGELKIEDYV